MAKTPHYYQNEAIDAVDDFLYKKKVINQLLVMATGTGKTYTAVKAIKRINEKESIKNPNVIQRTLWGTHTEELISQSAIALLTELELMPEEELLWAVNTHGDIIELVKNSIKGGIFSDPNTSLIASQIGIVKADLFDINKPYVMCSMQTLWRRLDQIPFDHFNIVVADEAHLFGSKTFNQSLEYFKPKLRLGLTATPYRSDGMLMGDLFDEIVYDYPIERGIKDGHLCELNAILVKTTSNLDNVHTVGGEFNAKELTETVNTLVRNNLVVNKYIEHASGRQFIAFAVDVQHAQDLCEAFKEKGINCEFIVGDKELTTDRKGLISSFKSGELLGLINVGVLVAGFDHKDVGCTISAAPTKSLTKFMQGPIGRGTRKKTLEFIAKFGNNCIILDIVDNTSKHKLINTYTLDKDKPIEEKVFISEKNRQLLLDVKAKRDAQVRIVHREKDVKVDLFAIPEVKISGSMRMLEPATEAQLAWIERLGYDIVNINYTKKHCTEIISTQQASPKQISLIKWKGYDVSNGVTIGEAQLIFQEIKTREDNQKLQQQKNGLNLPFNF